MGSITNKLSLDKGYITHIPYWSICLPKWKVTYCIYKYFLSNLHSFDGRNIGENNSRPEIMQQMDLNLMMQSMVSVLI